MRLYYYFTKPHIDDDDIDIDTGGGRDFRQTRGCAHGHRQGRPDLRDDPQRLERARSPGDLLTYLWSSNHADNN